VADTARQGTGNPATARRLGAGLDSATLAELEELLDIALDCGRVEHARELRARILALR